MVKEMWYIWGILVGMAGFCVWASVNTKVGKKLGYLNAGLIAGVILTNIGITPMNHAAYKIVNTYLIPIGICLCLLMANIRELKKCGIKMVIMMVATVVVMIVGGVLGVLFVNLGIEGPKYAAIAVSNFVGNMQTAAGTAVSVGISDEAYAFFSATTTIPWLCYSFFAYMVGKTPIVKWLVSYKDAESGIAFTEEENRKALEDFNRTEFTAKNTEISVVIGVSVAIAAIGMYLGKLTGFYSIAFYAGIGVLLANFTSLRKCKSNEHLSTLIFTIFIISKGCGAHWTRLMNMPLQILGYLLFLYVFSFTMCVLIAKLLRIPWEYMLLAHMACIGGPASAPPLANIYGWHDLVLPAIVIAILGQVFGAYAGIATMTLINTLI